MQDDFIASDRRMRRIDLGALMWVKCAVFFIGEIVALLAATGYSVQHYDLSYLGIAECTVFATPDGGPAEMCSPLYVAYNFGLMAFGVFLVLGIVLSRPAWPQSALATAGLALYAISGIGAVVTGAVPVDTGNWLHVAGASTVFVGGGVAILMLALSIRRRNPNLALYGVITAVIGLGAALLYATGLYMGLGRGGMERLAAYALVLWPIGMGAAILTGWFRAEQEDAAFGP